MLIKHNFFISSQMFCELLFFVWLAVCVFTSHFFISLQRWGWFQVANVKFLFKDVAILTTGTPPASSQLPFCCSATP